MSLPTLYRGRFAINDQFICLFKIAQRGRWFLPQAYTRDLLSRGQTRRWVLECQKYGDQVLGLCVCAVVPVDENNQWVAQAALPAVVLCYEHKTKCLTQVLPDELKQPDHIFPVSSRVGTKEDRRDLYDTWEKFIMCFGDSRKPATELLCKFIPRSISP